MYSYEWDKETGGYILLPNKITGVSKEVRPVFTEELRFLGFDKEYGWNIPDCTEPLMWAEDRKYIYKGDIVAETAGGGLYEMPQLNKVQHNLNLEPVNIDLMVNKNKSLMDGVVQTTLRELYDLYSSYINNVDIAYVAFSGGKDSIVMLDIVQRALPHDKFCVVFGNTTMELSDTYKIVDIAKKKWSDLEWYTAQTPFDSKDSWNFAGPPARTIRWCCGVHKSAPSILLLKNIVATKRNCQLSEIKKFKTLAFLGVRAEESDARSKYNIISDGNKHAVQINCNPILKWGTVELFLYIFERQLPINEMYRKGSHRVGCLLCPMAASWYECIVNHNYENEVRPYIDIIKNSMRKDYPDEEGWKQYLSEGGWKQRSSGKLLKESNNKIMYLSNGKEDTIIIKDPEYSWKKWMKALGDVIEIENGVFVIDYHSITFTFKVQESDGIVTFSFTPLEKSKSSIRFMYLFKNVLNKTAYCKNCMECMAECPHGALTITNDDIIIKNCVHCETCLDRQKGCIVAKSTTTTGDNNMSPKNIDRYKNFGLRQEWVELLFEDPDAFWTNNRMGTHMFKSFEKWGKEAGLIDIKNAMLPICERFIELGADNPKLWGYIFSNIAYESPIFNWFIRNIEIGSEYQASDLPIMLGDEYSDTTKKNSLSSLKDTLKSSPIGWLLGQGECESKGKIVTSITRYGWQDPEPIIILYSLYLFAEHFDEMGLYSFTLSDLMDDSPEREALSPGKVFGFDTDTLKPILQGLANNYPDYITVDFNKGFMENIDLPAGKKGAKAIDVLSLI